MNTYLILKGYQDRVRIWFGLFCPLSSLKHGQQREPCRVRCNVSQVSVDCCEWRYLMFEVFKMPHVWTHAEYADTVYIYGWCDGSVSAALSKNIVVSFQNAEFRTDRCFLKFSKRGVKVVHVPALMFRLNVNFNKMWKRWQLPSVGTTCGEH